MIAARMLCFSGLANMAELDADIKAADTAAAECASELGRLHREALAARPELAESLRRVLETGQVQASINALLRAVAGGVGSSPPGGSWTRATTRWRTTQSSWPFSTIARRTRPARGQEASVG